MGQSLFRTNQAQIAAPRPDDLAALPALLTAAFGPGRFAKTSERVREQGARLDLAVSRLAYTGGRVTGCCLLSHIKIGAAPALFLGPLAVHPQAQKAGLGAALVQACLAAAKASAPDPGQAQAILLVGAPAFFTPLGFQAAPKGAVTLPGPVDPARLLWLPLTPQGLEGLSGAVTGFPDASPP